MSARHEPSERHRVVVEGFWPFAVGRARGSLETARQLNDAGFPTPAFVWAVRSAEMFLRDCVLFCHFFEESGDVDKALKKARRVLRKGKWAAAIRFVETEFGPFDQALTTDGENAWAVWQRWHVSARGEMVHGRMEATSEQAQWTIDFAERFISWFSQRLATSERGPLRGALRKLIEEQLDRYREASAQEDFRPEEAAHGWSDRATE